MFQYPERTRKDRVLPKNKVYGNAQPSNAVRRHFVSQVEQIVWRNVLISETVNLPARDWIEGIQVFEIALKTGELKEDVLRSLDRAIPWRLFFELTFNSQVRFAAAYKRSSEGNSGVPVVEDYFLTPWQPAEKPRLALPVALDLAALYEQMLFRHMEGSPLAIGSRAGETIADAVERCKAIRTRQREQRRLKAALRREHQFNRKVGINAALRRCEVELSKLTR
jgi:Domain of unknown function (DUF4391)